MSTSETGVTIDHLSQAAIDALPVAVFLAAVPTGDILRINRRAAELCGPDLSRPPRILDCLSMAGDREQDTSREPDTADPIAFALKHGTRVLDVEAALTTPEGRIPVSVSIEPVNDSRGAPVATLTVCHRISTWKDAASALRRTERRLTLALKAGRLGAWELDLDTRVLTSSPQCRANHGLAPADDLQLEADLLPAIDPDFRGAFRAAIDRAIAGHGAFEIEVPHRWPDGTAHWLFVAGEVIDPTCMVGVSLDITERRRIEQALRDGERLYKEIVETANEGIWTLDGQARITFVNRRMADLVGYPPMEMIGCHKWDFMFDEDISAMQALFDRRRQGIAEEVMDIRFRHRSGSEVWTLMAARPLHDSAGRFSGALDLFMDVTTRRQAEQALRDSEERFRTLADNISQLAWMADETGSIFWYNKRWFDYTGTTLEEMQGWGWQRAHHPDHVEGVVAKIRRCFESGEVWEDTFPLRAQDGSYRWFLSRAVPIQDERGRIVRWFGTNTDVTEQRRAAEALLAADRGKDEFLAVLGHELRNPIAPIMTAVTLLQKKGPPDPALQKLRDTILRQTLLLSKLVDDLLDVGRIINGKLRLERHVTDLGSILKQAIETAMPQIEHRHHALEVALPDPSVHVDVDARRIVQAVSNLLHNAAKYMHDGGRVELTAAARERTVVISVKDQGVGISPEMLERIFDRFVQIDSSAHRAQGGLGIGLALVKAVVELHGGTVEARSDGIGKGSEFTVRLPRAGLPAS